ncbi:putative phytosulfokines 6 [Cornus florida]|uniref:putative phytosulfokines 6 n=1 Tax=Cornus florida TaxID=4283 RepID=UPI00289F3B53|nr:putative phytosulfokines 6 [Cornus florida]
MKKSLHSCALLFFLLFLVTFSQTSARFLATKGGKEGLKLTEIPTTETEGNDSLNLMGFEICDNGDEECLKRRMVAEAHLDYIYTQHHKP